MSYLMGFYPCPKKLCMGKLTGELVVYEYIDKLRFLLVDFFLNLSTINRY